MSEYDDNPLVRALRAPGTSDELAGEGAILAAYRSARRRRGGLVRRLGLGGTTAVLAIGLSGGVAAATWTNRLPDPVQRIAHDAFGAIGVPGPRADFDAPTAVQPQRLDPATPARPGTASPTSEPTAGESDAPSGGSSTPATEQPATPAASPSESGNPGAHAPHPPNGHSTQVRVAEVTAAAANTVSEGSAVRVTGRLTDADAEPVADRAVVLAARSGAGGWRVVARGRSDSTGSVSLTSPALTASTTFRLVAAPARSRAVRVAVQPTLAAKYVDGTVVVTSTAAHGGERVRLVAGKRTVGTAKLDDSGTAVVELKKRKVAARIEVLLRATRSHAPASVIVVVPRS